MIWEICIALLIGGVCGTFTGLIPGIHINLVATFLLTNIGFFSGVDTLSLAVFIAAMSITHTFIDFIPSIFLGAPEEDTILSVLPGHRMLMLGRGAQAMMLTLQGSFVAIIIALIFVPVYIIALPFVQEVISGAIPYLLLIISFYIILRDDNVITAFFTFALSGIIGFLAFNLPVDEPLLPLLSGLFGLSGILTSISLNNSPRVQEKSQINGLLMPKSSYLYSIIPASIVGPLCSFLPGIGSSHISMISSEIVKHNEKQFLFLSGISNTLAMMLSFVAAYAIGKTRTGSAAAIKDILQSISLNDLMVILIACVISGIFAYFIGKKISSAAVKLIKVVPYSKINIVILGVLVLINVLISNYLGLVVLVTSSALGYWVINSGSRRINLMGSLIIPTILYYLVY